MKSMKILANWLQQNGTNKHYLFLLQDFRALMPNLSDSAFKTLINRAVSGKYLTRVCRGLYLYKNAMPTDGLLLFHAAAMLRSQAFNYISLETALSDAGVISQVPMQWISIMSSGRSAIIPCGQFGTIEFIHTNQKPTAVLNKIVYDDRCGLWRASVALAIRDMRATRRNMDLIDWNIIHELI